MRIKQHPRCPPSRFNSGVRTSVTSTARQALNLVYACCLRTGVAHPPPNNQRGSIADLSAAEIGTTQMGRGQGVDVLVEHDHGNRVGSVQTSWESANGSLHVAGVITDPAAARDVRSGKMRGLSLGTSVIQDMSGKPMLRSQDEISVCVEPRRPGCYINRIDGQRVRTVACFSNSNRARMCFEPTPAILHKAMSPVSK